MNRKPIKIIAWVAVGTQGAALLLAILFTAMQESVVGVFLSDNHLSRMYGKIFPWDQIIPAVVFFVPILVIAIFANSGIKSLKVVGIICAAIGLSNRIANMFMGYLANMIDGRARGASYLALSASLRNAISLVTSPLSTIATALFFVACGMCIMYREN